MEVLFNSFFSGAAIPAPLESAVLFLLGGFCCGLRKLVFEAPLSR